MERVAAKIAVNRLALKACSRNGEDTLRLLRSSHPAFRDIIFDTIWKIEVGRICRRRAFPRHGGTCRGREQGRVIGSSVDIAPFQAVIPCVADYFILIDQPL